MPPSPPPPPTPIKLEERGENSGLHALQIPYRNPSRVFTCLHLIWERFKLDPLCYFLQGWNIYNVQREPNFGVWVLWFNHGSSVGAGFTPG
jgi:hypothetical protein